VHRRAVAKAVRARELWDRIGHAAWASADPGLQFDTTINDWHTCPESGRIRQEIDGRAQRGAGSFLTRRWRKPDSNSPSHLNEKLRWIGFAGLR
jgi:hypothetical protein